MQANISVFLDTRRKKENGYPVKLRVYYKGSTKLFPMGVDLTEKEFESSYNAIKPKMDFKRINEELRAMENKAIEIAKGLQTFTFSRFSTLFYGETRTKSDVFGYYTDYIEMLTKDDRIGSASSYQCSKNSIQAFIKTISKSKAPRLMFDDITPDFLKAYEKWMLSNDNSETTVGIYLRPLRALYNLAITNGEASQELYPFKKALYQIPSGSKVQKALTKEELKSLYETKVEQGTPAEKAKDFWFFSYACCGININDIAELKYSNIDNESISFIRSKTKRSTKGNQKPITVGTSDFTKAIIKKYGNKPIDKHSYVFPIYNAGMDATQKKRAVQNFVRFINQHIKPLAKSVGIEKSISSYWARHSFATKAMRNNTNRSLIQDSLGHVSASTTERYLAGFNIEVKQELANSLLDF